MQRRKALLSTAYLNMEKVVRIMTKASCDSAKMISYYSHSLIVILLIFGFRYLPTIAPLTDYGMQIIGIFLGCLYGWTMVSVIWPSFLGLLALGFTQFGSVSAVLQQTYGGDTYLFCFFMLSFAALITKAGVTDYIAKWVISRKIAKGKPWTIAFLVYTAAYVVGALVSVMPSIVICWTLTYQLCEKFGYTNKDLYPKLMVIGVVNAALMGHCLFPFKAFAVMMLNVLNAQLDLTVNFGLFTIFAFVMGFGGVVLYLLICRFIYRPDVSLIENSAFVYENTERLNTYQKQVLVILGLLVLAMFLPGFLPSCGLKTFLTTLGNTGIVVAFLMVCSAIVLKNGHSFADAAELIKTGVPWPTMILLATAMTLAAAIGGETGIKEMFQQILGPILNGHGTMLFFALVIIIGTILTNIINNVVVGLILMPIICSFSITLGFPPEILTVAICLLMNVTFFLPSGSPVAAFLHGNSQWVSSIEVQKYSVLYILLMLLWAIVVCLTLGNLLW